MGPGWGHTTGEAGYLESGTWGSAGEVVATHKGATCSTGLYLMWSAKRDGHTLAILMPACKGNLV